MTDLLTATHFEGRPLGKAYKLRNGCIVRLDPEGPWKHGGVIMAVPLAHNSYNVKAGSDLCFVTDGADPLTWKGGGFGEGFDVVGEYVARPAFAPWQVWRHRDGGLRVIAAHDARREYTNSEWLLCETDGAYASAGTSWFSTKRLSELLVEYVGPMAIPEGAKVPEVKFSAKVGDVWRDDTGKEWLVAEVDAEDEDAMYLAYPRVGDADGSAGYRWFDAAGELETDGDEDSIRLRRFIRNAFTA